MSDDMKTTGNGKLSLERIVELLYTEPRTRFGLDAPTLNEILTSDAPNFAIWDLDVEYEVDPDEFETMGRSTPFEGMKVRGRCLMTVVDGKVVYKREK